MTAAEQPPKNQIQHQWPEPMNAKQWEQKFPGVLDGAAIMAGGANVIMQLALLPVGHGVADSRVESGALFKHPIKRARTTITYLAVALMGTPEEKLAYRSAVNQSHKDVHSRPGDKVEYNAFNADLQLWVAACLYWGIADTNKKLGYHLTPERQEELYQVAENLGTTLQVRPGMWPKDTQAFEAYWQQGLEKLEMDDKVRNFLTKLVDLKFLHPLLRLPLARFHRFLTTGFLPQPIRDVMHLEWNEKKQHRFDWVMRMITGFNATMPRQLRQLPFLLVLWDFRRRIRKGLPLV